MAEVCLISNTDTPCQYAAAEGNAAGARARASEGLVGMPPLRACSPWLNSARSTTSPSARPATHMGMATSARREQEVMRGGVAGWVPARWLQPCRLTSHNPHMPHGCSAGHSRAAPMAVGIITHRSFISTHSTCTGRGLAREDGGEVACYAHVCVHGTQLHPTCARDPLAKPAAST